MRRLLALTVGLVATSSPGVVEGEQKQSSLEQYSTQVGERRSLEELLDFAGERAPDLQEARERLGLGEAAIEGAEMFQPFNPQLSGEFGVGLGDGAFRSVEVTLKQRLEVTGQRGLRIEAAHRRREMFHKQVAHARWEVRQRIRRLYRLGLLQRMRLELEREILAFTREVLDIARKRLDAGETSRTSVVVTRAEAASARRQVVDRWSGYIESLRELGTAVGWDRQRPPQPTGALAEPRPVPPKQKLLERARRQDPQLAVLRARLEHLGATLETAKREVWPNPLLGVGLTRSNIGTNVEADKLRLIVGLPLPIWEQNQGDIARSQARIRFVRQQIKNRKTDLRNRILEQVEVVDAAYRQARIYQKDVLPTIEDQFEMLQEGFDLGELSLLDVMDARDRLLKAKREQLSALAEYVREMSELEHLLGRPIWGAGRE